VDKRQGNPRLGVSVMQGEAVRMMSGQGDWWQKHLTDADRRFLRSLGIATA
jgi:hypothetical protein